MNFLQFCFLKKHIGNSLIILFFLNTIFLFFEHEFHELNEFWSIIYSCLFERFVFVLIICVRFNHSCSFFCCLLSVVRCLYLTYEMSLDSTQAKRSAARLTENSAFSKLIFTCHIFLLSESLKKGVSNTVCRLLGFVPCW